MILEKMLKEEWRTQSKLYKGKYLAALPLLIFLLTYLGGRLITNFSAAPVTDIGLLISAFGFFTGLAAGSIGFSGNVALDNVLGDANFLIFSSRTLPVKKTVLIREFIVKDILFYVGLYLGPVALAAGLLSRELILYTGYMAALFIVGLFLSILTANAASNLPSRKSFVGYEDLPLSALSKKSLLDVLRSSGGILKILMSMALLLGLYGYIVNYVPLASYLLQNPLMSFSVITGMMSVTVYNWLNTYDEFEDYGYLPVSKSELLESKFKAFKLVSFLLITAVLFGGYLIFGGNLILALITGLVTAYYVGAVTMYESGLNPNEDMINAWTFTKFLIGVNLLVMPLLVTASFQSDPVLILAILAPMAITGRLAESMKLSRS